LRWVRQASKIGHLIIEQIKDGLVIIRDGEKTSELAPVREPKRSLLKGASSGKSSSGSGSSISATSVSSVPSQDVDLGIAQPSVEEMALVEQNVSKMQALQADLESGRSDPQEVSEKSDELMKKLTSDLQALHSGSQSAKETVRPGRISAEESNKLDDLGKQLKHIDSEPNRVVDRRTKIVQDHRTTGRRYRRIATRPGGREPNSTQGEK
jgi:hypothetical protein